MAFILLYAERAEDARIARLTLEHAGHEVLSFTDATALQAAVPDMTTPPGMLVLDMAVPKEGPPLWGRLRTENRWRRVPVLLLSEGTPVGELVPDDVLAKPYALRELTYRVGRLLARQPEPA